MKTKALPLLTLALWLTLIASSDAQTLFTKITNGAIATDQGNFAGFTWTDFSNRGVLDLIVCDFLGGSNVYYHNNGDGTFAKITSAPFVKKALYQVIPAAADFDNDGFTDLLISAGSAAATGQPNALYQNDGNGIFTPISGAGVTNARGYFNACSVADYDNDGYVDIFIPAGNGTPGLLFHNDGNGAFSRILSSSILTTLAGNSSVSWVDYDNDGFEDVLINYGDGTHDCLFHNNRNGTFTRILTNAVVTNVWADSSWGAAWGDYDNDGFQDLFVTGMQQGNRLYHNDGNGAFSNVLSGPMLQPPLGGGFRCCAWGDFDNDGYLDLFVAGYNSANRLFHNNGDGTFTQVATNDFAADSNLGVYCQACGWADYDNDGFLDLFVTRAPDSGVTSNLLYHNDGNTNAWLEVKLVGTVANRSAIGAKVHVHATIGGKSFWQLREISSGGGRWIQPLVAHFGLGDATNVDTLRIEWPSGTVQEIQNVAPKQILTITEPAQLSASVSSGAPQFALKSWSGMQYGVQSSTDLVNWSMLETVKVTNANGLTQIVDPNGANSGERFYRAVSR